MEKLWGLVYIASIYGGIVGIIVLLIKRILKDKINAKWAYLIWSILIIKLLIPYGPQCDISIFGNLNLKNSYINYENQTVTNNENITIDNWEKISNTNDSSNNTSINTTEKTDFENTISNEINSNISIISLIKKCIPYIWLIGFFIVGFIFILSHILLHRKLKLNDKEANEELSNILDNCKSRMNINSNITVIETDFVSTPSVIGILSPKILIPSSMMSLTEKELEYVFLHEVAHYKRKDTLVNYFLLILQAIHWFNPVVWYCFKHIREDMEYATDEKVLLVLKEKENNDYGKAILTVLEKINYSRFEPSIIGIIDDKKGVEKRIKKIKGMKYLKNKKVVSTVIGISLIAVLSIVLLTNSVSLGDSSLSQFQNHYFDVVKDCVKGKSISIKELKNTLADLECENINGIVSNVDADSGESTSYETDIYEYKSKNEVFTVAYLIDEESNKSKEKIDSVTWEINRDNKKENNIYMSYYTIDGATSTFDLGINNLNLSGQEEIFKLIDTTNNMYDLYFKIARKMESQDSLTLSDIEDLLGGKKLEKLDREYDDGIRNYFYREGELQLSISYNEKENNTEQISIFGERDELTSLNYVKNSEEGNSISIYKSNITQEEQKSLIKKLAPIYEK